jgi:hypothetical protein
MIAKRYISCKKEIDLLQLKNQFPLEVFNSVVARLRNENAKHVDERSLDGQFHVFEMNFSSATNSFPK